MSQTADNEPMIPKVIHFVVSATPADYELKNIEIATQLHSDWKVLVWRGPIDPSPFVLSRFWSKANSARQLANLIGFEAVRQHGGFYLDSSIALCKSLDPLRSYSFVGVSDDGHELSTSFFGAAPQHPALIHLVEVLDRHEVDWRLPSSITTGSQFVTREIRWREGITVIPRETFFPHSGDQSAAPTRLWTYGARSANAPSDSGRPQQSLLGRFKNSVRSVRRNLFKRMRYLVFKLRRRFGTGGPRSYPASGVICVETIHGSQIFLLGEDASVTPEIALHGSYEFEEERFIERVVRPGDWAIDVGANVGMFSLLFAQCVGAFGRVFCYEPNPLPASLLKKSLLSNWLHNRAEVRQKAIGACPGVTRLRFSKERLGDATLAVSADSGTFESTVPLLHEFEEIDVEVVSLDADFPVDLPIRFLKVDAEGFDHHVLRGSARLLQRHCIDILMLECVQEVHGQNWPDYLAELKKIIDYGYGLYTLTSSSKLVPLHYDRLLSSDRARNIFLVSKHATKTIRELA